MMWPALLQTTQQPRGVQGEATAALAEIASRNKSHLPEVPLEDGASGPPLRPLGDILANVRLRRRLALLLALWPLACLLLLGLTILLAGGSRAGAPLTLLACFGADAAAVTLAAPLMERLGRCSVCSAMLLQGAVLTEAGRETQSVGTGGHVEEGPGRGGGSGTIGEF